MTLLPAALGGICVVAIVAIALGAMMMRRKPMKLTYVDPDRFPAGWFSRVYGSLAANRIVLFFERHFFFKIDPHLQRATGGRLGVGLTLPTSVLETRGARTGVVRRHVVMYFHDHDKVTIFAANGGGATHPAWYHNLVADPDVVFGDQPMRAVTVTDDAERKRLWSLADRVGPYPKFRRLAAAHDRIIPVVQLTPTAQRSSSPGGGSGSSLTGRGPKIAHTRASSSGESCRSERATNP